MRAQYVEQVRTGQVRCLLCPHRCLILANDWGRCGVRFNAEGTLLAESYGRICAYALDPLEKKPLYHFYPGQYIASFGSYGCNLNCDFCQNHRIAQAGRGQPPPFETVEAERLVALALSEPQNIGIAATYNEPFIQFEYLMDLFGRSRKAGLKNVMVTNGFVAPAPLEEILPLVDAFNVDLKGFTEEYYSRVCGGHLAPVLDSLARIHGRSHLEVTLLLIPGLNDQPDSLRRMFQALAEISPDIPLHISRYFPSCRMQLPPTPVQALERAEALAKTCLKHVYLGNLPGKQQLTRCLSCRQVLVARTGTEVKVHFSDNNCPNCGAAHHIPFD